LKKPTCETCPYFVDILKEEKDKDKKKELENDCYTTRGICSCNPPVVVSTKPEYVSSGFPEVSKVACCGEYPSFPEWIEFLKEQKKPIDKHCATCAECIPKKVGREAGWACNLGLRQSVYKAWMYGKGCEEWSEIGEM